MVLYEADSLASYAAFRQQAPAAEICGSREAERGIKPHVPGALNVYRQTTHHIFDSAIFTQDVAKLNKFSSTNGWKLR
jgi:hypothetical protein